MRVQKKGPYVVCAIMPEGAAMQVLVPGYSRVLVRLCAVAPVVHSNVFAPAYARDRLGGSMSGNLSTKSVESLSKISMLMQSASCCAAALAAR